MRTKGNETQGKSQLSILESVFNRDHEEIVYRLTYGSESYILEDSSELPGLIEKMGGKKPDNIEVIKLQDYSIPTENLSLTIAEFSALAQNAYLATRGALDGSRNEYASYEAMLAHFQAINKQAQKIKDVLYYKVYGTGF